MARKPALIRAAPKIAIYRPLFHPLERGGLKPYFLVKLIEHRLIDCQLRQEYLDSQKYEILPRDSYQFSGWNRAK